MRLVEVRLLEGPNVYRLEPAAKIEVAVGRRRTWYGQRMPGAHALVHLGAAVPLRRVPPPIRELVAWVRRLHRLTGTRAGLAPGRHLPVTVHRSSDPGHWLVVFPWREHERAEGIAEGAWRLLEREVDPGVPLRRSRSLRRTVSAVRTAGSTPPTWISDAERRLPIVSISGTNGKSTTTRMLTHILRAAGRHVGTTTSDGVLVDERLVEPGDWTGPGGARQILDRSDVEVAVLETARGGILLKGVGYESDDAAILTNVTSDHLDLQGIHTLPELAEVKATIARITRPGGLVVLNADDPLVAAQARHVRAPVCYFSLGAGASRVARHLARGGRALLLEDGWLVEAAGPVRQPIVAVTEIPAALFGLATHNVANALAAAGGALALGVSHEAISAGLRDYRLTAELAPGRLNLYRLGARVIIVDFAHNEAGVSALLDVAQAVAGGAAGRARPVTIIIGTAGDRPDDTLRGIGRIAAQRADHVVIKETLKYLRGRSRESALGEFRAGAREGGARGEVPTYESEPAALRAVLTNGARAGTPANEPGVIALMCHEDRAAVAELLADLGARPISDHRELLELMPRLQPRPYPRA
ncbi:MAG: Mur ligase family protein [Candidatus Limnocylindrales bacterium]